MLSPLRGQALILHLLIAIISAGSASAQPAVAEALRLRVEQLHEAPATNILGTQLLQPDVVAHFFQARGFKAAWLVPSASDQIRQAILAIERDGLSPDDYHRAAIEAALNARAGSPQHDADLQLLLTDAVAAMIDHVRYGKVRAASLDTHWNVDARAGAPPLDMVVAHVAAADAIAAEIESFKPNHFIYEGLKQALARLRAVPADGWPKVPAGASIKPGQTDRRVIAVRKRLEATGELPPETAAAEATFDDALEDAVIRFQEHHRLTADGTIGKATVEAMNVGVAARVAQVRVNLERARWVLSGLRDSFVLVNLPAFKVYLIRDGENIWEARTQIGKAARQTPSFRANMRYLVLNPDWTVPPTILAQDVLGGMRKGQNTIAKKGLTIIDRRGREVNPASIDWQKATPANFPYTLRQPPGADNALGRVKFIFPNEHHIFLHDTPSLDLFRPDQRTFSSGCIRVERPLDLAAVLLEGQETWTRERIDQVVAQGKSETVVLRESLPVLIVYWTASVGASGDLRFARDVYTLDPAVLHALDEPAVPAPVLGK